MTNEWISVEDDLPETQREDGGYFSSKKCLVVCAGEIEIATFQHGGDNMGWRNWCSEIYEEISDYVTHWMPLPEPPKD